ncbi:unnamed protein product [Schistosoma mattheei]|uniref:Uncharacterized protein n=1 Tax=Schistosoma mattheei TaxID=31246 RepID=A0A183Q094_9TREM|nr:unnamed protein product [Schistosoma mattheei]
MNSPSIQFSKFPEEVLSSANSFQSVGSHLSNNSSYWSMTVQVPTDVLEEIDKLADYALGEYSSGDSQMHPNDNDINPGIQAYARCLVYMQKIRASTSALGPPCSSMMLSIYVKVLTSSKSSPSIVIGVVHGVL